MLTDDNGQYTFTGLRAGNYTVEITGFDATGVAFSSTSSAVTVGAGESKVWSFEGTYVRESAIAGQVSVEGNGLSDVTVSLQGMGADESEMTDEGGQFTFSGLRAGEYQLAISGYDTDEYGFSTTSATVRVEHGRTANVPFEGILLRTAAIMGQVSVEGEGLEDVTVSLSGEGENLTAMTDESGQYTFSDLPAGNFQVGISGYDTDDYSFETTSKNIALALGETETVPFEGILLRTSGIAGRVSIGGAGLGDVTVTLSGAEERTATTDATGQYAVAGLAAGDYTVTISGYDASEYAFPDGDSEDVTLDMDQTRIVNFAGRSLRTAAVAVMVTADGVGVPGVTATLFRVTNPVTQEGSIVGAAATGADGGHTFSNLLQGLYLVQISGADAEIDFLTTALPVTALTDMTAEANFPGTINRTASIGGTVTIDGAGMAGVMVMLSGDEGDQTRETDADGAYSFAGLRRGDYEVSITNPNEAMYNFARTSQDVALGLGQAQDDISFAGTQVLMSSISGQVTVEGAALAGVTVTLGGAGDDTHTTGDDGLYAFLNLGSGTYTVSMANPDDAAYIFDTTPVEVELGNTDEQTHNFGGTHTREASVSGMLFIDEGTKNNEHDEGEYALAAEGVKVTLVGPTLLMRTEAETDADGAFTFPERRQGSYQLMLTSPDAAVMDDFGYGGDASYDIEVGVGADGGATQNLPFDITHQTVNFTVNLKSGDLPLGAALPGATITLFSDAAGATQIGTEMTDADGTASIRFEREGRTGNTVHAAIAAPADDYHAAGGMQPVTWDSQHRMTDAANAGDIVNTKADFSFSGATITTDSGGGRALGGWAIEVTSGDEAVDGAPDELGDDGSESFSETVTSVPKTYKIAMAGWEDQSNDTISGDGGERYTSTTLSHTHDGLSLAGTSTDAGTLVVTYTTQRVRVYVYKENDQVMGYTGNVLGGDERMGGIVDVDIEYIGDNGRTSSFEATDSVKSSARGGVYQFWNVPAHERVIVSADEVPTLGKDEDDNDIPNTNRLLKKNGHSDELAAYTDMEANGIMGGLFGAHGGFHHTVDLCPLMSDEGDQRHGECGSFAFVETFAVDGQAWKNVVGKTSDDFRADPSKTSEAGLTVSMNHVPGENLAGDDETFTDENGRTLLFDFGHMAAGVYEVTAPSGWIARRGPLESPTNDLDDYLTPLDTTINIDVTPMTGYAYGSVVDGENRRMAGVTVNVNGVSVETDSNGRYVAEGFGPRNYRAPGSRFTQRNRIVVTTAEEGSAETTDLGSFAANTPRRIDVDIEDAAEITTISGMVTHSSGGAGVGGVRIWVDGRAPLNKNARTGRTGPNNIYITGSDGSFSVRINAKAGGATATITASRDGMFFSPVGGHTFSAVAGQNISGLTFTAFDNGTIHGRVVDGSNSPISGVIVTATQVSPGTATDADTTGTTGTYSLSVRYGQYGVMADKDGYTFTDTTGVNVPNDGKALNDLIGTQVEGYAQLSSLSLSGVSLCRGSQPCGRTLGGFESGHTTYTATVGNSLSMTTLSATAGGGARVTDRYPDDADLTTTGHQIALDIGTTYIEVEVVSSDDTDTTTYNVAVTRRAPSTVITGTITDAQTDEDGNTVGVSGVQITVTGAGDLLNGRTVAGRTYVTTNASGQYTAVMESGGDGTVTPTKTGYSFQPATQDVTLNADSVKGIDFTGSSYATITGTVMADGAALEGVTVKAANGAESDSDDTDRRGRFSVSVPAGTITITATKTGYTFADRTVFADAGETRSLGNITATGNMAPLNVMASRDTTSDANTFGTTVSVSWTPGPGGAATQYQVQTWDTTSPGSWSNTNADLVTDTTAEGNWEGEIRSADVGSIRVRVLAQQTDGNGGFTDYPSDEVTVAAVDPSPSNVEASRDIDAEPDALEVTWDAKGNNDSAWRVVISFDGGTTWYSAGGTAASGTWTATATDIVNLGTPNAATNDGTTGDAKAAAITAAEVDGALMFRVDSRQGAGPNEDNPWIEGPTASVAEKG